MALPAVHVASSRLAWRIARAVVARDQGWSLDALSVSRRWRFQVGRARWTAQASVSFLFHDWARRGGGVAVFAIHFEGPGPTSAVPSSPLVEDLRGRLGPAGKLAWTLPGESRPSRLLAELDRIAQAFGSEDRHRVPPSRSRTPGTRLAVVADAVLAHGRWSLETPDLWRRLDDAVSGSIKPMPSSGRGRPELSSMLFVPDRKAPTALVARAESRGYVDPAGEGPTAHALMKVQPLSLRAALAEARFIEEWFRALNR